MPFPFSNIGSVVLKKRLKEVSIKELGDAIQEGLQNVKARDITRNQNNFSFSGGIFRFVSNWNILVSVSSGEISIEETAEAISIHYVLKFTEMLIIASLMVVGGFGAVLWQAPNLSFVPKVMLLAVAWSWLFGMNYLITILRFPSFIRKITGND